MRYYLIFPLLLPLFTASLLSKPRQVCPLIRKASTPDVVKPYCHALSISELLILEHLYQHNDILHLSRRFKNLRPSHGLIGDGYYIFMKQNLMEILFDDHFDNTLKLIVKRSLRQEVAFALGDPRLHYFDQSEQERRFYRYVDHFLKDIHSILTRETVATLVLLTLEELPDEDRDHRIIEGILRSWDNNRLELLPIWLMIASRDQLMVALELFDLQFPEVHSVKKLNILRKVCALKGIKLKKEEKKHPFPKMRSREKARRTIISPNPLNFYPTANRFTLTTFRELIRYARERGDLIQHLSSKNPSSIEDFLSNILGTSRFALYSPAPVPPSKSISIYSLQRSDRLLRFRFK